MATQSLGELLVQIGADIKDLKKGQTAASKEVDKFEKTSNKSLTRFSKNWKRTIGATIGGVAFAALIKKSAALWIKEEQSIKQLEARLKSTNNVAGRTITQLTKQAAALQKVTTFGNEATQEMQSLLLTFTKIQGPIFDKSVEAIQNVATAMGTDLKSAALQVGKALNDPAGQLSALSRSGIQFTAAQKDLIKSLVATNRVADAQRIILGELETQFGGAAKAAREGLGGAVKGVENAFGDLLEGIGKGGTGLVGSLGELEALLSDPATLKAVSEIANAFVVLATGIISATGAIVDFLVEFRKMPQGPPTIAAQTPGSAFGGGDVTRPGAGFANEIGTGGLPTFRTGSAEGQAAFGAGPSATPDALPTGTGQSFDLESAGFSLTGAAGGEDGGMFGLALLDSNRVNELQENLTTAESSLTDFFFNASSAQNSAIQDMIASELRLSENSAKVAAERMDSFSKTGKAFKDLGDGLVANNSKSGKKLLGISEKIGAAVGLANTFTAATEALKIGYPQGIFAAASVIGVGLGYVAKIKGGSGGGGGGSASAVNTIPTDPTGNQEGFQTQQQGLQDANITISVEGDVIDLDKWMEEKGAPAIREAVGRGVEFNLEIKRGN